MKITYKKRNGNGHTTCVLCNRFTWDSFCYDLYVNVIDKLLFKTVICDDCLYELKNKEEIEKLEGK